ncbi:MAG: lipopolysaccharide kinase InaA family protein [Gemmataceae bacterium]
MPKLLIHPDYQRLLQHYGLKTVSDFLNLQGVIYSGHLDRNVSRVEVGNGTQHQQCFLKREHQTRWKDRLENWTNGFGWTSKSVREFHTLQVMRKKQVVGIPTPIAAGEDDQGQAFLLLKECIEVVDLRELLENLDCHLDRQEVFTSLATTIARFHATGWVHKDLYSKHVLFSTAKLDDIILLDWQRAVRSRSWNNRLRDLSSLHATIAPYLAPEEQQLSFLRCYLDTMETLETHVPSFSAALRFIRQRRRRLWHKSRFHEMRQPPLRAGAQNLIWFEGETFCFSREFATDVGGRVPEVLEDVYAKPESCANDGGLVFDLTLPPTNISETRQSPATLVVQDQDPPTTRFWNWFRKKSLVGKQFEVAKTIFRLERFGFPVPTVLAVGHKVMECGTLRSFLLTEQVRDCVPLDVWLVKTTGAANARLRRSVLSQAGAICHKAHQVGYSIEGPDVLGVKISSTAHTVMINAPERVKRQHPRHNLSETWDQLGSLCSQDEFAYFLTVSRQGSHEIQQLALPHSVVDLDEESREELATL